MTYPQCPLQPQEALEILRQVPTSSPIVEYVVAQEPHKDGNPHLHAFIRYEKKTEWGSRKWDLGPWHGNYQTARAWYAVKAYCTKRGNFIASFDVNAAQRKKSCGRDLNKRLIEESLVGLVEEGDVLLKDYVRLKACKEAFLRDRQRLKPRAEGFIPNNFNLLFPVSQGKQRHFWIWSEAPNKGKTTFLVSLDQSFPCYWYSFSEAFQSPCQDTQFVLLDEYSKANLTATQLNQMCDGSWSYPVKGCSAIRLEAPIVVVCSNKSPQDVYPNCFAFVLARFQVFNL